MRTTFLNLMFLFVIVGCTRPAINEVQQAVEVQAELLVNSGLIINEYVVLYEIAMNDSNHIYRIIASDYPALGFDYPSRIIKYKDKYLCFIELDESPMSEDEMIELSDYSGNLCAEGGGGDEWLLVVSKRGEKKMLMDISLLEPGWLTYFNITELWPYFSGYVKGYAVQMGIMSHDIELNDLSFYCNMDSIKQKLFWDENPYCTLIANVYGQMYLKNNTDSTVCISSGTKRHYAVVNGRDSLYLSLCDSLPIVLGPNEKRIIDYESLPGQDGFFKNLALEEDPWGYFYNLFCRSAYCLMNVNGEDSRMRVMFHDIDNYEFKAAAKGHGIRLRILNRGIYDKKDREMPRFRFWSDKWDAMSDADRKRIWDDTEAKFQRNVENRRNRK